MFASVAGTQALCQLLNGLAAFLLIRMLPKDQYAWFTIATAMAAVLNALSEGGIGTAVLSVGGKVWQDRPRLSALVHASLGMLNRLSIVGTLLTLPAMAWLLHQQDAPWTVLILLCVLILCPQWMATRTVLLGMVNRLQSRLWQLQSAELTQAGLRFTLTVVPGLCGAAHVLWAAAAVAVAVVAQGVLVRKQVWPLLEREVSPEAVEEFRPQVTSTVRRMYPSAVFNCVQSQIAIWLLGALGSSSEVADIGALARLAFIANMVGAPLSLIVAPAFARCHDTRRLRRMFAGLLGAYGLFYLSLTVAAWLHAPWILKLFGPNYGHLSHELLLYTFSLALAGLNGICWTLNLARGWLGYFWLTIPISIATQGTTLFFIEAQTVAGAIWLGIILNAGYLLHSLTISIQGFRRNTSTI
ncbi:lipopolysaccharide biosynthesis protein [Prosthecobacter sp.]